MVAYWAATRVAWMAALMGAPLVARKAESWAAQKAEWRARLWAECSEFLMAASLVDLMDA